MGTFLFDKIVFGPVKSRRLGVSLGVNLLPLKKKVCNFNCIYCECGKENQSDLAKFPSRKEITNALENKFCDMMLHEERIDVITFAGNGEPTLHPDFPDIIDDILFLREAYFPDVKIAVLSNATMIKNKSVFDALLKVDMNILKIDSGIENTCKLLNNPVGLYKLGETIDYIKKFNGKFILQTMFMQGTVKGVEIDNTTDDEVDAFLEMLTEIKPSQVMIYTIDRETALPGLRKISILKLNEIAVRVKELRIPVKVSG
jgi:wyosine [tRNA(Phe)-imidazoG37] synthetase (radical SAM superfamily)